MSDQSPAARCGASVASGRCAPLTDIGAAVELREFVSATRGASGLSSGTATFQPGGELPYHVHSCSEAMTVIQGEADVRVEGRRYRLGELDSIHFPAGIAHSVLNTQTSGVLLAHWAFATEKPSREIIEEKFPSRDLRDTDAPAEFPECLVRFSQSEVYELADKAYFTDLFGRRFGAVGICGGYGRFGPGASLPCHVHRCDESITIISGSASCQVMGQQWQLSNCDTAFVPEGLPHRFLNETNALMAMIWVYASDEPERTIVDARYCAGLLSWPTKEKE
jgi:putative monooxygenase